MWKYICTMVIAVTLALGLTATPTQAHGTDVGNNNRTTDSTVVPGSNQILIAEQRGIIRGPGGKVFLDVRDKVNNAHHGQLGVMGIDATKNHLFMTLTRKTPNGYKWQVARFPYNKKSKVYAEGSMKVLFHVHEKIAGGEHLGGGIQVMGGGILYAATGENAKATFDTSQFSFDAERHSKCWGKIFRMKLDGSVPKSNPYPGYKNPCIKYQSGRGLRNPTKFTFHNQRLLVNDVGNKPYGSEHTGAGAYEELNHVTSKDRNYGWPNVSGKDDQKIWNSDIQRVVNIDESRFADPFFAYAHRATQDPNSPVKGCALTGAAGPYIGDLGCFDSNGNLTTSGFIYNRDTGKVVGGKRDWLVDIEKDGKGYFWLDLFGKIRRV